MKLIAEKLGSQNVNIKGQTVKFVNGIAEVDDDFGAVILKSGLPGIYELGKQPAPKTPKEVKMQVDFNEKEKFLQDEIERYKSIINTKNTEIKNLTEEVRTWKEKYTEEKELRAKIAMSMSSAPEPVEEENTEQETQESVETEEGKIRAQLETMTKNELIDFGKESNIDMTPVLDKKKSEIIDYLLTK